MMIITLWYADILPLIVMMYLLVIYAVSINNVLMQGDSWIKYTKHSTQNSLVNAFSFPLLLFPATNQYWYMCTVYNFIICNMKDNCLAILLLINVIQQLYLVNRGKCLAYDSYSLQEYMSFKVIMTTPFHCDSS